MADRRVLCVPGRRRAQSARAARGRTGRDRVQRGHSYVTFIDMDRRDKPVIFFIPSKGKACVATFRAFMLAHGGELARVTEVVCDMSPPSWPRSPRTFPTPPPPSTFMSSSSSSPLLTRCARPRLASASFPMRPVALAELGTGGFATAMAYRAKEMLRWIRQARTPQAARWRITRFIKHIGLDLDAGPLLHPLRRALRQTFATHIEGIVQR